jgi:hypothetical protein
LRRCTAAKWIEPTMRITIGTVHSTGWWSSQPQWKSSAGASGVGRGFVTARGQAMLISTAPP